MRANPLGFALACAGAIAIVACCSPGRKSGPATGKETTFTLVALGELRGQIEPCGCTTDPLGDLARTAKLVAEARGRGPVVVVDSGSLLYTQAVVPAHMKAQEELKADLLARVYKDDLQVAALGLGPNDLASGPGNVRLPRQVANLPAGGPVAVAAPGLVAVGNETIGVLGVTDPALLPGLGATDPVAAARAAVTDLRGRGAARIVAVATMDRKAAVSLAREVPGIDIMVVGLGLQAPAPDAVRARAEQVGDTWMVFPTDRGQVVSKFEITLRPGGGPLVDAIGPAAADDRRAELAARIATLDEALARFAQDPSADPTFVDQQQHERAALAAEQAALADQPLRIPAAGSYFQLAQVRIAKALACDTDVVAEKQAYARAAGQANVEAAKAVPVKPVPPGTATFVGVDECANCHTEAVEFWKRTRHAGAWETLEQVDKQFDYDCTSCHVTGWDQPGGATMAANAPLRDVQCETCHGPGSLHVDAADDATARRTIVRSPAPELCAGQCHTKDHSDTFDYTAYLRDIVGPGHGAARRQAIGDGPTGRQLRAAGLEKAGKAIGAGCPK
ncbi:MAG TPA: multiheme c-type cytochrome [Kofleriaceae bacterium]|nr:multiheme c-type cytochrome [Kofleriaceae bacterium]